MIEEKDLLPYGVSDLPEGPWLVFAPHPDDETFGMGGSLLLASRNHTKITLVVMTDGAAGGDPSAGSELVGIRRAETEKIAKRLDIEELHFWDVADRQLKVCRTLINRIAGLIEKIKPASVFFPSSMEPHPDHRAAALLVWEGVRQCLDFCGGLYAYDISVQGRVNRLVDITKVADEKKALMSLYQSQIAENNYIEIAFALNVARTFTLPSNVRAAEGFYAYEHDRDQPLAFHTEASLRPFWLWDPDHGGPEFSAEPERVPGPGDAKVQRVNEKELQAKIAALSAELALLKRSLGWRFLERCRRWGWYRWLARMLRAVVHGAKGIRKS